MNLADVLNFRENQKKKRRPPRGCENLPPVSAGLAVPPQVDGQRGVKNNKFPAPRNLQNVVKKKTIFPPNEFGDQFLVHCPVALFCLFTLTTEATPYELKKTLLFFLFFFELSIRKKTREARLSESFIYPRPPSLSRLRIPFCFSDRYA